MDFDPIGDLIDWVWDRIDSVNRRIDGVFNYINSVVNSATGWIERLAEDAYSLAERAWEQVNDLKNAVVRMVDNAIDAALGGFYWVLEQAADFFTSGLNQVWRAIEGAVDKAEEIREWAIDWVTETIENAIATVMATIEHLQRILSTVYETLFDPEKFAELIERAIEAVW